MMLVDDILGEVFAMTSTGELRSIQKELSETDEYRMFVKEVGGFYTGSPCLYLLSYGGEKLRISINKVSSESRFDYFVDDLRITETFRFRPNAIKYTLSCIKKWPISGARVPNSIQEKKAISRLKSIANSITMLPGYHLVFRGYKLGSREVTFIPYASTRDLESPYVRLNWSYRGGYDTYWFDQIGFTLDGNHDADNYAQYFKGKTSREKLLAYVAKCIQKWPMSGSRRI